MKYLVLLATLVASLSIAGEVVPAANVKEAKKQAEQKCAKGCLVLSAEDVKNIDARINDALNEVAQEAFETGKQICNRTI